MFEGHNFAAGLGVDPQAIQNLQNTAEPTHSAFGEQQAAGMQRMAAMMSGGQGMPGLGPIALGPRGAPPPVEGGADARAQAMHMIQMVQSGHMPAGPGGGPMPPHAGEQQGMAMLASLQQRMARLNPEQMEKFQSRMSTVMAENQARAAGMMAEQPQVEVAGDEGHGHSHGGGGGHGHSHDEGGHGHSHDGGGHGHSHAGGGHGHSHGGGECTVPVIPSDAIAPSTSEGYMYQHPAGSQLARESLLGLQGGGHYEAPEFGWGELAPRNTPEERQKLVPGPLRAAAAAGQTVLFTEIADQDLPTRIIVKTLPLLGRVRFLVETQGMLQWGAILFYWIYGNFTTWTIILLPAYDDGRMPMVLILWYAFISVMCISSFLRASTINPGRATADMAKYSDADWTYCAKCDMKRPPKSHHCRRCRQCVLKMDHHCPWINNCVGEENQYAFIQLVAYAYMLSLTTLVLSCLWWFYMPVCKHCDLDTFIMRYSSGLMVLDTIMGVLMTLGAGGLVLTQHISVVMNTTTIEWMKLQTEMKASGHFTWDKMPTNDKGCFQSYRHLCGEGFPLFWPFPFGRRRPVITGATSIV